MNIHSLDIKKNQKKEILILLACLIIGFALRFYTFDQKSLWMDEIYTFNDSRGNLKSQIESYQKEPSYLHPPLFFTLTHLLYPFTKPERDLRIIPLIFGTLSIPMIYLLSRLFSPSIALPCTISLTFMAYHISLSQDGRSYSLLMFLGMVGLYFFMKHLKTSKRGYLFFVSLFFTLLFHSSYSSIPFIALSQILWFYRPRENETLPLKQRFYSFLILNTLFLLLCLPWLLLVTLNYKGQPLGDPLHIEDPGSFSNLLYGILHDWVPHAPLMIASTILLILFPLFPKYRNNAFILLAVFLLPIGGLYLFCRLLNITHFITSRYFINFLPLFFITLYLSLHNIEERFERLKRWMRLEVLFVILFIASNLVILPLYYRSEKQDFRALTTYLKKYLQQGDKIYVETLGYIPGMLHYFGTHPKDRYHIAYSMKNVEDKSERRAYFNYQNSTFTIYYSDICCTQYVADGSRLWIITSKWEAERIMHNTPCVLKGYFDGSFLNFQRFPTDASMYLFLWDPRSPNEKGIDLPIE